MKDFNKYFIVGTNSDALHDTMNGMVVGELIRCKDCKNNPSTSVGWISCPMTGTGTRKPNDFCSYAEPKEK